jgi:hypothetical protein
VTGYFRPVKNWNGGKQEEFRNRLSFSTPAARRGAVAAEAPAEAPVTASAEETRERARPEAEACVCA